MKGPRRPNRGVTVAAGMAAMDVLIAATQGPGNSIMEIVVEGGALSVGVALREGWLTTRTDAGWSPQLRGLL